PPGRGAAHGDSQARLYRKSGVIEPVFGALARFETCAELGEPAGYTARRPSSPAASAMRHISPQEAAALVGRPRPMLNERQERIVDMLKRTPQLATMRRLLLSFRSILCRGKVSGLRQWAKRAATAGLASITGFVRQLKKDWAAVENAVKLV